VPDDCVATITAVIKPVSGVGIVTPKISLAALESRGLAFTSQQFSWRCHPDPAKNGQVKWR
jgi:hypothetical protein